MVIFPFWRVPLIVSTLMYKLISVHQIFNFMSPGLPGCNPIKKRLHFSHFFVKTPVNLYNRPFGTSMSFIEWVIISVVNLAARQIFMMQFFTKK
jgi:hypothetical protein